MGRSFCLLAHNAIDKMTAIVGLCELLEAEAYGSSRCRDRLHKIREVGKSAAATFYSGECELQAANQIVELQKSLAEAQKGLYIEGCR